MLDLILEIRQTLRGNKLRTFLTGISVAWGVFMLILLLGVARGVTNSFENNMGSRRTNNLEIYGGYTSTPFRGYRDGRYIQLRESDREAIMRDNAENVAIVLPSASNDTVKVSSARDIISGMEAVYPDFIQNDINQMVAGRMLNNQDIEDGRRVILLRDRNARLLFDDAQSAVGQTVSAFGLSWTVVGVYESRWRSYSYVPYTAYKAITGNDNDVYRINVEVQNVDDEAGAVALENGVRGSLARAHEFNPADDSAVWIWNQLKNYFATAKVSTLLTLAVWIIGLFSLLTGIVGVSNIMFVSVRERTHEIGVRRAIGAKPRSILFQILAEGVAITALFGYAGVFCGMVILQIVDHFIGDVDSFSNPTVDISIALEITLTLIVAGALAGLFPALKALKIKPVEALRDE